MNPFGTDRRSQPRFFWPVVVLLSGLAASVAVSLILGRFIPVFLLFLPFFWTGRRTR